jgi:integrase
VDALAYDLKNLALQNGEGSYTTKMQRHRGLQMIARELAALGYKLPAAKSLKEKHIAALVGRWQGAGLSTGTLKNRLSWVRWWAGSVRRGSVVPRQNDAYEIPSRMTWKGNKAHTTTGERLESLPDWMQLAVKMQMAFGLRLEESLKFRPDIADQGDHLTLKASWCKGGRGRTVPITHPRQRALLDDLRKATNGGAAMPIGVSYIQARKALESATWGAGIRNMHGHRHWYAQWRYQALTGAPSPAAGGKTYENMTKAERAADYRARLVVSRELGHNRVEITDAYLGGRFAKSKPA